MNLITIIFMVLSLGIQVQTLLAVIETKDTIATKPAVTVPSDMLSNLLNL